MTESMSEERYRKIFEYSPDSISITRLSDGKIISANRGFKKLAGEDVIGKTTLEVGLYKHPEDREKIINILEEKGELLDCELEFNSPKGNIWGAMSATLTEFDGETYIIAIIHDFTNRKTVEDTIRKSEELYRTMSELSPIATQLYDCSGKLTKVNKACLKLLGVDRIEELNGFSVFTDSNITDKNKEELYRGESVAYKGFFDFEKVKELKMFNTKNSGVIYIDVIITSLGKIGYVVRIQDISKREVCG